MRAARLAQFLLTAPRGDGTGDLLAIALHGVYRDRAEVASRATLPLHEVTLGALDELLTALVRLGLGPEPPGDDGRPGLLLISDDGYASILRALPLIERHGVRLVVCPTVANVRSGRCFWWDVAYREGRRAGHGHRRTLADIEDLKRLPVPEIEAILARRHGPHCLDALGDTDRPLTPAEIARLAAHPQVRIGNHGVTHTRLVLCDDQTLTAEIEEAQAALAGWCGYRPDDISYPNGDCDARVAAAAGAAGLVRGWSDRPGLASASAMGEEAMMRPRWTFRGCWPAAGQARRWLHRRWPKRT